jgi:hypothetical protein
VVVTSVALYLIPYALIAAASPLGIAAALTVLHTGRVRALGLAVGVLAGQLLACGVLVLLGTASVSHRAKRPHVEGVVQLGLGVALLVLAIVVHHRSDRGEPVRGRSQQILDRLRQVSFTTTLVVGLALGVGGPKRLVLTALASASIAAAGLDGAHEAGLVIWYSVLATVIVWGPVLAALLLGDRALDALDTAFRWLSRHQRPVSVTLLGIIGAFCTANGLALLVA